MAMQNFLLRLILVTFTVGFATTATAQSNAPAEALDAKETPIGSLERVPATTGYYFSTMNHRAVVNRFFESNAWAAVKSTEVARGMKKAYRRGKSRGYEEYNEDNPFSQILKGYGESFGSVAFQSGWQIAKEVVQNELFIYVDNDALQIAKAGRQFQNDMLGSMPSGNFDNPDLEDELKDELVDSFITNFADVESPTVIMGARLDDPDEFRGMVELAKSLAEQGMLMIPDEMEVVKQWWNITDLENQYLLALDIKLADLPLEEMLEAVDDPDLATAIAQVLEKKEASVVLGIVNDLLVVGLASNKEKLIGFGDAPLLIDSPMLKRLRKSIDAKETITAVGYVSPEFCKLSYSFEDIAESQQLWIKMMVGLMEDLDENEKEKMVADINAGVTEFVAESQTIFPTLESLYGYSTLEQEGLRMYALSELSLPIPADQPIKLGAHAGPDTVGFVAMRPYRLAETYAFVAKWTSRVFDNLPKFATDPMVDGILYQLEEKRDRALESDGDEVPEQPRLEDAQQIFETTMGRVRSIAEKVDVVTRKRLLPEIAGQEVGVFIDMQAGPNSWCDDMPAADQPLAIPLPAMIVGVKDSEKITEAGARYLNIAAESLDFVKEMATYFDGSSYDAIADMKIVQPERMEDGEEVSFRWNMLSEMGGFDPSLRTGSRVSKEWVVMNFHEAQAKRLIHQTDSGRLFGPAATDEPSIALMFYDHRVAMKHGREWLEYGISEAKKNGKSPLDLSVYEAERDTLQFTEPQLREFYDSLATLSECFHGLSVRSYQNDDGVASDWLLKFEDIAQE